MRSVSQSDFRELLRKARSQGWEVGTTRNNHLKLVSPAGSTVFTSGTPSDWRSYHNFRAKLKREGLVLD